MAWLELTFGKHKGKTLPQIIFSDPDYFFWAMEEGVFHHKGGLERQAQEIYRKATSIKVPALGDEEHVAEYAVHPGMRGCVGIELVPCSRPQHQGSTQTFRKPVIDMSVPRQLADYDKLGYRIFIRSLKFYLFGDEHCRLTKQVCERFFDDPNNFVT
ncbi:MAG TPA: hypothetical protein VG146_10030 [Verrucomicrobiae bacterium]|nr:hypothetical protein [Verrucomicrobiae bacterium]